MIRYLASSFYGGDGTIRVGSGVNFEAQRFVNPIRADGWTLQRHIKKRACDQQR